MSESHRDRLKRELSELVDRLTDDASEEALQKIRRVEAVLRAPLAAAAPPSDLRGLLRSVVPQRRHAGWVALLSRVGVSEVPLPRRWKSVRLPMLQELLVFAPAVFIDPIVLADAMQTLGVKVLNLHGSELDFARLESLCNHPGWLLIDQTLLGGPPISEEQKLLRMEPLELAPRHVPAMDLASFLMYCAYCCAAERRLPAGKWTLAGTRWKETRRSLRVECTQPSTIIVSHESHHLKHGTRPSHQ